MAWEKLARAMAGCQPELAGDRLTLAEGQKTFIRFLTERVAGLEQRIGRDEAEIAELKAETQRLSQLAVPPASPAALPTPVPRPRGPEAREQRKIAKALCNRLAGDRKRWRETISYYLGRWYDPESEEWWHVWQMLRLQWVPEVDPLGPDEALRDELRALMGYPPNRPSRTTARAVRVIVVTWLRVECEVALGFVGGQELFALSDEQFAARYRITTALARNVRAVCPSFGPATETEKTV